jgi:tRNA-specific 2-thiouridylase
MTSSSKKPRVVIAMSGGVDSSTAAALLVQKGYDVIGIMLRLWTENGMENHNRCCTPEAMSLARRVAAKLGIPFYQVDVRNHFREKVVQYFIDGYLQGITPNPCLMCNRHIRFGFLLQRALSMGADYLATGHYARLETNHQGMIQLLRGVDRKKDQSYVLSVLNQDQLSHALFPLGVFTKAQVREIAHKFDLPVGERTDSQDLCFLAGGDYRDFLGRNAPEAVKPGPIINRQGETMGNHHGLPFFTIGQRKGLGIAASKPHYVLEKETASNTLIVGTVEELGHDTLVATNVNWISGRPPSSPIQAEVMIRYQAKEARGTVTPLSDERVLIQFDSPLRNITPGQAAVFFSGEIVLGNGTIELTGR